MKCTHCGSENSIKSGFARSKQRYECKDCHCHFVKSAPKAGEAERQYVVKLYCSGVSFRQIGRLHGISHTTARRWVKGFAERLPQAVNKTPVSVVELDEQWHFLQKNA
jgi:transposase-like protein